MRFRPAYHCAQTVQHVASLCNALRSMEHRPQVMYRIGNGTTHDPGGRNETRDPAYHIFGIEDKEVHFGMRPEKDHIDQGQAGQNALEQSDTDLSHDANTK